MKSFFRFTSLAALTFLCSHAFADTTPTASVGVRTTFIPKGFDDNDQAIAVLDGYLPSSCYRVDHTEHQIDLQQKIITVKQFARVYPGPCLLMLVPYTSEVNFGVLPKGSYKVLTNNGSTVSTLDIAEATNAGPDDFLYAPVEQAHVERTSTGEMFALLEGRFTNTCMALKDVQVIYSGATIEVLPVMEVAERPDCTEQLIPFKKAVPLVAQLPGRYLLHVRSLNGKAVNTVFPVFDHGDPIH